MGGVGALHLRTVVSAEARNVINASLEGALLGEAHRPNGSGGDRPGMTRMQDGKAWKSGQERGTLHHVCLTGATLPKGRSRCMRPDRGLRELTCSSNPVRPVMAANDGLCQVRWIQALVT
jgi:hypothetical protein